MKDFEKRLIQEADKLNSQISKLTIFTLDNKSEYAYLQEDYKALLASQLAGMRQYKQALDKRIEYIGKL